MPNLCSCGTRLGGNSGSMKRHAMSRWHSVAREARKLRQLGFSYAEVARQVRLARSSLHYYLWREKL